jgi:hypothetical protein
LSSSPLFIIPPPFFFNRYIMQNKLTCCVTIGIYHYLRHRST